MSLFNFAPTTTAATTAGISSATANAANKFSFGGPQPVAGSTAAAGGTTFGLPAAQAPTGLFGATMGMSAAPAAMGAATGAATTTLGAAPASAAVTGSTKFDDLKPEQRSAFIAMEQYVRGLKREGSMAVAKHAQWRAKRADDLHHLADAEHLIHRVVVLRQASVESHLVAAADALRHRTADHHRWCEIAVARGVALARLEQGRTDAERNGVWKRYHSLWPDHAWQHHGAGQMDIVGVLRNEHAAVLSSFLEERVRLVEEVGRLVEEGLAELEGRVRAASAQIQGGAGSGASALDEASPERVASVIKVQADALRSYTARAVALHREVEAVKTTYTRAWQHLRKESTSAGAMVLAGHDYGTHANSPFPVRGTVLSADGRDAGNKTTVASVPRMGSESMLAVARKMIKPAQVTPALIVAPSTAVAAPSASMFQTGGTIGGFGTGFGAGFGSTTGGGLFGATAQPATKKRTG